MDLLGVVAQSRHHRRSRFSKYGSHDPSLDSADDARERFTADPRHNEAVARQFYGSFVYRPDRVDLLRQDVEAFAAQGSEVVLFISPIYAWQIEEVDAAGLMPAFEQWKRDLVAMVEAFNRTSRIWVRLWDFSGYNSVTTEAVPASGPMRWYWEPSHYTSAAGNLVLGRVLGQPEGVPTDFGVELTPANIETVIAATRAGHQAYLARFPSEANPAAALR